MNAKARPHLVFPVSPRSTAEIELAANEMLRALFPSALAGVVPVPLEEWAERILQRHQVHVVPVDDAELPDAYADTNPFAPGGGVEVRMRASLYDGLSHRGPASHFPRATLAHELGHVALHVEQLRDRVRLRQQYPALGLTLPRADPRSLKPFQDPEWQAWTFAGALLAPRSAIMRLPSRDARTVGEAFRISVDFASNHLRRLKIAR